MLVQELGNAQLGAHAVSAGDQHRLLHARHRQTEAAAEAAHVIQAALIPGAGHMLLHKFHGLVTGGNVHTGSGVAGRLRILVFHK